MTKKILIVDDDLDTLAMVGRMLERHDFKILAANNGQKALDIASKETPDIILLDVMMPGMDGYEVTRRLRAMDNTAFIPILLFTAKAQVDDKLEGFEAGADDYLTKPTHPAELIARVKSILSRPQTGALATPGEKAPDETDESKKPSGEIIGVIAAKGGLGTSTVAINLAVSLFQQTSKFVTLAEYRPGVGTIGLSLGYRRSEALNKLLNIPSAEITRNQVEGELVTHGSGIQLLLASFNQADAELESKAEEFGRITHHLGNISNYTILDLGPGLTVTNRNVIPLCTRILLVVEPVPTTITQTKSLIENLEYFNIDSSQLDVILVNRTRLEITVPNMQVEQDLGVRLAGILTPAPELAYQAMIRNHPIILQQPSSITARQFNKLAEQYHITAPPD